MFLENYDFSALKNYFASSKNMQLKNFKTDTKEKVYCLLNFYQKRNL